MGWELKVLWNDGASAWTPIKDLKEFNLVDLSKFTVARGIDKEPAFSWWVPCALKKLNAIAPVISSRVREVSHDRAT